MGLGFGLLSAQLAPGADHGWRQVYQDTLDLAELSEELGFSSVWTTEHHLVDDGYMPSLLVTSAAIAARTSAIEIGTGVVLAPLHHPIRLAEDAATVQLISDGRLALGVGLGWSDPEFAAFGIPRRLRGRAMGEILEILPRAWSGDPFHHQGEVYQLPELAVRPTPHIPIPLLVGAGAEPAVRRAARLADGLFSNAPTEVFLQQVAWARDEMERVGRDPSGFRWLHYSILVPDGEWDRLRHDVWAMAWKYTDMAASAARPGVPPAPPALTPEIEAALVERSLVRGTGSEVARRLEELRSESGVPVEFVARSYFPTLPLDDQIELMRWLATDVIPALGEG